MATYTDEQKAEAVALAIEVGLAEAHARTEIPKSTLSSWLSPEQRQAMAGHSAEKTATAVAERLRRIERRRAELADALLDDAHRLRGQFFAPCVERKAMTVSLGRDAGQEVRVVDVELTQPTFRSQQAIATTLAILVDKVQVLTGGATERIEVTGDARARAVELADELAQRRARKVDAA